MVALYTTLLLVASVPLSPERHERDSLAVRMYGLTNPGPYLVGEPIAYSRFSFLLLNHSALIHEHDPFVIAARIGDLELRIQQPDGKPLSAWGRPGQRDPFTQTSKLKPGEVASWSFRFANFGYGAVHEPGRYRIECKYTINKKVITAPAVTFEVVATTKADIVASVPIPTEGFEARLPVEEQSLPFVQQVTVANTTVLIYRRYNGPKWGGKIDRTFRLAELPSKVEMKVEGAFGDKKPLTITYKDPKSPTGTTKLVINSVDGTPWTAEDEAAYQMRLKKSPPAKPSSAFGIGVAVGC